MSNPNQEIIESRLAGYIDGELDANERVEIEQHLQQNPQYRKLIDDLRKQRDMLRALPREAAPLDLAEAFTNQLERSELLDEKTSGQPSRMRIYAFPRLVAAAAIVLLTVGLAFIVLHILPDHNGHIVSMNTPPKGSINTKIPATSADRPADENDLEPDKAPVVEKEKSAALNDGIRRMDKLSEVATAAPSLDSKAAKALEEKKVDRSMSDDTQAGRVQLSRETVLQRSRNVELDQLAKTVSADARVKELFARDADPNASSLGIPQNARVLVVRAEDVQRVETELASFFDQSHIDWHPAPRQVELAFNASFSHKPDESPKDFAASNKREIESEAIESGQGAVDKVNLTLMSKATPATPTPALIAPSDAPAPMPRVSRLAPATDSSQPEVSKLKMDAFAAGAANATAGFDERELKDESTRGFKSRITMSPNPAPVETIYVARKLTRRQIEDLNVRLAIGGETQDADVNRSLGEYRYATNSPTNAPAVDAGALAVAKDVNAQSENRLSSSVVGQAQSGRRGGFNAPSAMSAATQDTDRLARKQEVAKSLDVSQLPGGGVGGGAGPATRPLAIAEKPSSPTTAPSQAYAAARPTTASSGNIRTRTIELSGKTGTAAPSTQPASTLAIASDDAIDVVIVVQKELNHADMIAAPFKATSIVPTTSPTTQPTNTK